MAVVLMIAIMAIVTMPLLQNQVAVREIETIARRFIAHAHFARQQALHLGEPVRIAPPLAGAWDAGWEVSSNCLKGSGKSSLAQADCTQKIWITQGVIAPIFFRGGGRHFVDPHSGKTSVVFNPAGAAKTAQGGFVANRLILGHRKVQGLERQLILGSGGRWRICDPARDAKRCH